MNMECRKAFDLDGVLAEKPPMSEKKWGKMNGDERKQRKAFLNAFYFNAKPLLPYEPGTVVITARKNDPAVQSATLSWFKKHYNTYPTIYFLDESRSVKNVIAFKSGVLRAHNITHYYEDNKKVLKGLKKEYPECLYFFVDTDLSISVF